MLCFQSKTSDLDKLAQTSSKLPMKLKQLTRSMLYNKIIDQNGNHPQSICYFVSIALTFVVKNDLQNNITKKT